MAHPKPPVEAVVDTAVHPLFARLREEAGFAEFSGATLETMLEAPGLKMVLFAEDPNLRRETLDIAVIGPELRKALGAAVASGCTRPSPRAGPSAHATASASFPPSRSSGARSTSAPPRD